MFFETKKYTFLEVSNLQDTLRRSIMDAKDVKKLPWKKLTDWTELPATSATNHEGNFVNEMDMNIFLENVYRDISRQLNISYERLLPILKEENEAFYNLKCCLFDEYGIAYRKDDVQLLELKNTLRVPDISSIPKYKVSICLKMFEDLSDMEKIEFLQKIGKINVKIECLSVQTETTVE